MTSLFQQAVAEGASDFTKLNVGESLTFMFDKVRQVDTKFGAALVADGRTRDQEPVSIILKPQMAQALQDAIRQADPNLGDPEPGAIITLTRVNDVTTPNGMKHIHTADYKRPAGASPAAEGPANAAPAPEPAPAPAASAPDPADFFG